MFGGFLFCFCFFVWLLFFLFCFQKGSNFFVFLIALYIISVVFSAVVPLLKEKIPLSDLTFKIFLFASPSYTDSAHHPNSTLLCSEHAGPQSGFFGLK